MNQLTDAGYTAYVGIDWAAAKHDICVQAAAGGAREFACISSQPEGIKAWAQDLYQRFGGPIAVALELSKGPIVSALQKYDFMVLYPINPSTLANYRETFTPSGAKDDPTDAELAVDLITRHPERFSPLKPQSVNMRKLIGLVEQRDKFLGDRGRLVNRLGHALKQYYPQVLEWFSEHNTVVFCDFLTRWPTLTQVKRARKASLERFFKSHHVNSAELIEKRITIKALKRFDEEIAATANKLPDYNLLFSPLPGAAQVLAPRLLAAFGEDRQRYPQAAALQKYSGIAPVTKRSGKTTWVHWRWQCPTFVRQTFVDWVSQTINKSAWAGAYYRQQRAKGCTYQVAVRALAFKWIRILHRCWQDRTPYDESKYLEALRRKGSPLLKYLAEAA